MAGSRKCNSEILNMDDNEPDALEVAQKFDRMED